MTIVLPTHARTHTHPLPIAEESVGIAVQDGGRFPLGLGRDGEAAAATPALCTVE